MSRTAVAIDNTTWTWTVTLTPEYYPTPENPHGSVPYYAECTVRQVTVWTGPWYGTIYRDTVDLQKWNVRVGTLLNTQFLGSFTLTSGSQVVTFRISSPDIHVNRAAGGLSEIVPAVLSRDRGITDTYEMDAGIVTIEADGFGVANFEYGGESGEPIPDLYGLQSAVYFDGNPNCTVAGNTPIVIESSAVNFDGASGHYGEIPTYGWHDPDNYQWVGDGQTLRLELSAWSPGPNQVIEPPETDEYYSGQLTVSNLLGTGWAINPSAIRVCRQSPNTRYPASVPAEFENALIWCGFIKQPWSPFTIPPAGDCEQGGTGPGGEFADGDAHPCYLSELAAADSYYGSDWSLPSDNNPPDNWEYHDDGRYHCPVLWYGPTFSAHVDKKWLLENHYHVEANEGEEGIPSLSDDSTLVIDADLWDATSFTGDPWHTITPVLDASVNVDLSGVVGTRVSAWTGEGVSGGDVGTTGAVSITVPADAPASMTRALATNFDAQIAWVKAHCDEGQLPTVYNCLKQNYVRCTGGGPWPNEDVVTWPYAWLRLGLTAPEGVSGTDEVTFALSYQSFGVTDAHVTGSARVSGQGETYEGPPFDVTLTPLKTLTWTITGLAEGANTKYLCLMVPPGGPIQPDLALVRSLTVGFPALGAEKTWKLTDVSLVLDPNPLVTQHLYLKFGEDYRQGTSGGFRGRIDQNPRAIWTREQYKVFEVEPVISTVERLIGSESGVNLDAMRTLRAYLALLSNCTNGFTVELTEQEWTDWYAGDTGAACDLETISAGYPGEIRIANRAGSLNLVPNLLYKPRAWLAVGGGIEGLKFKAGGGLDTGGSVVITRQDDTPPPETVETLTTDATGIYVSPHYIEAYDYETVDLGGTPAVIMYAADKYAYFAEGKSAGQLKRRQIRLLNTGGRRRKGGVWMHKGPTMVPWVTYLEGDNLYIVQMTAPPASFGTPILVDSSGSYDAVKAEGDDRMLWITAHNSYDDKTYIFYSRDQGETWTGPTPLTGS